MVPESSIARRLEREKEARKKAEAILRQKSEELFHRNEELSELTHSLEVQVEERTRALALARDEALAAARARSDFIANMSHELRTPLNGVLGTLRMLASTQLSDSQRKLVQIANESGSHLLEVINDVLDFSKIDAGKMKLETLPVDLSALIQGVADTLASAAEAKNILLSCHLPQDFPIQIQSDPLRLRQILLNLLSNAIKFTPEGKVDIYLSKLEQFFEIRVADTGIGMTEEQQSRIFEAFDQADGSITRQFGGTGLGLSICGRLIELLEGEISLSSQPEVGTEFVVRLPLVQTQETSQAVIRNQQTRPFENKSVLLAEDNSINQMVAVHLLEEMGVRVECVDNGREALEKLEQRQFDLILMDLQMPEMGGIEATEKIRASESDHRYIPIVAMTAHTHDDQLNECRKAGMNDHLSKPIDPTQIETVLNRIFKLHVDSAEQDNLVSEPKQVIERCQEIRGHSPAIVNRNSALNLEASVARLGGAADILIELIQRFVEKHADAEAFFVSAVAAQNHEEIAALSHSIKGSAANLGAEELATWAGDIEQGARSKQQEAVEQGVREFAGVWQRFSEAAEFAISEYQSAGVSDETVDSTAPVGEQVLIEQQVDERLTSISKLLDEDLSLVCEHIDELNRSQLPSSYRPLVQQLKVAMDNFDVDALADLLQSRRGSSEHE
ncbi:MAG: ATP-binding protein [Oceanobacter sp.]